MNNKKILEIFVQILISLQFVYILFICNNFITNFVFLLCLLFYMIYVMEEGDF